MMIAHKYPLFKVTVLCGVFLSNQSALMEAQKVVYIRRIDGDFEIQAEHIVDSFHREVLICSQYVLGGHFAVRIDVQRKFAVFAEG